jgi:predicted metal-dependent phosphoesterase TrpH
MHVHTTASDGTASPAEVLDWAAEHTDLSVIAICDHNTNEGALEAAALARENPCGVEVVVGQEVESTDGHILGLWTPEMIAPGMDAARTVAAIHAQGGLAVAAHPYAPLWWDKHGLCRGTTETYDCTEYDAVEVANSTPLLFFANFHARAYWRANMLRLAAVGGSDAHMLSVIGTSRTIFPGSTAEELRVAIVARTSRGSGPTFNPFRTFAYARKVPTIKQRDRERKQREAERGLTSACDACESCANPAEDTQP